MQATRAATRQTTIAFAIARAIVIWGVVSFTITIISRRRAQMQSFFQFLSQFELYIFIFFKKKFTETELERRAQEMSTQRRDTREIVRRDIIICEQGGVAKKR